MSWAGGAEEEVLVPARSPWSWDAAEVQKRKSRSLAPSWDAGPGGAEEEVLDPRLPGAGTRPEGTDRPAFSLALLSPCTTAPCAEASVLLFCLGTCDTTV